MSTPATAPVFARRPPKPIVKTVPLLPTRKAGNIPWNEEQPDRRRRLTSAFRAHRSVEVDFAAVGHASTKNARRLIHQLQQCAQTASPLDGGEARLFNLNEQVSTVLERLLASGWEKLSVVDRDFAHSSRTRTSYSSTIVLRLPGWERDPYKGQLIAELIERDGGGCAWCGVELAPSDRKATLDHVHLRSAGGCDHIDNLLLACDSCNRKRGDIDAEAFLLICARSKHRTVNERAVRGAIKRTAELHRDGPPADVIPLNSRRRRRQGRQ